MLGTEPGSSPSAVRDLNCWANSLTPGALRKKACIMPHEKSIANLFWVPICDESFVSSCVRASFAFQHFTTCYDLCLPYLELTEPGHVDNIFSKCERASAIISLTIFLCPSCVLSSPPLVYTDVLNYILRFSEPA